MLLRSTGKYTIYAKKKKASKEVKEGEGTKERRVKLFFFLTNSFREWALPNAEWAQKGTLRERGDVPNWLLDMTIWVNSHWQELDIFNITGGESSVVKERVSNIAKRFDIHEGGLGFHW